MVEVVRPGGRDVLPRFVPSRLGDDREIFIKGRRGHSSSQHCREDILLDEHFIAHAHMLPQHRGTTCRLRSRARHHPVSHAHIIH